MLATTTCLGKGNVLDHQPLANTGSLDNAGMPTKHINMFSFGDHCFKSKSDEILFETKKQTKNNPPQTSFVSSHSLSKCNYLRKHNEYKHKITVSRRGITQTVVGYKFSFFFSPAGGVRMRQPAPRAGGRYHTETPTVPPSEAGSSGPYQVCESAAESGMWLECSCGGCTRGS